MQPPVLLERESVGRVTADELVGLVGEPTPRSRPSGPPVPGRRASAASGRPACCGCAGSTNRAPATPAPAGRRSAPLHAGRTASRALEHVRDWRSSESRSRARSLWLDCSRSHEDRTVARSATRGAAGLGRPQNAAETKPPLRGLRFLRLLLITGSSIPGDHGGRRTGSPGVGRSGPVVANKPARRRPSRGFQRSNRRGGMSHAQC